MEPEIVETLDDSLPSSSLPPSVETLNHALPFSSSSSLETLEERSLSSETLAYQSISNSWNSTSPLSIPDVLDEPSPSYPTLSSSLPWSSSVDLETFPASNMSLECSSFGNYRPFAFSHSNGETKPYMMGAGLANLGNTCFLNAVLQCFTHTVPLVQSLRSCNHANPCERAIGDFCVLCALREHIELSLAHMGEIISPSKLVDNLSYLSSSFQRYEQEDAHEFLQCLLDRLDSCCLDPKTTSQDTFVKQIFGGCLKSQLRCCNCGHCSVTVEPLIDLSLETDDADTLPCALKSFTKVEKIDDQETKFVCENCLEEVSMEKQLMLDKAPAVATFHLKRFKNDGSYVQKIDKYVEYPLQLDLQPYTSSTQNNNVELKYELYAVVVHNGYSSCSGHYYCFICSSPHTWYKLDDSKVTRVSEEFVLHQEAYILFYARQGTPWFSSLMETQKQCLDPKSSNTSPKSVLDGVERTCTPSPCGPRTCDAEVNGTRNDLDRICSSSPCGPRTCNSEVNETRSDLERICTLFSSGVRNCSDEINGVNDDVNRICNPISLRASTGSNQVYEPVSNVARLSSLEIDNSKIHADVHPQAPSPRPPSPELYAEEEPTEASYNIPRDHLLLEKQIPCKRQLNKALEDSKRKEACRLVKTMPAARRMAYMTAITGSCSEGSLNKKKKRRMGVSRRDNGLPDGDTTPLSNTFQNLNHRSVTRTVTAGDFR